MLPLDCVVGWAGPVSWLGWTSGPVELDWNLDPSAQSACSVGMFAGWRANVTSWVWRTPVVLTSRLWRLRWCWLSLEGEASRLRGGGGASRFCGASGLFGASRLRGALHGLSIYGESSENSKRFHTAEKSWWENNFLNQQIKFFSMKTIFDRWF